MLVIAASEQRSTGAGQSFLLDFAQRAKEFLSGLAQNYFLRHLERRDPLAIFQRLLRPHAFVALQRHAAAFQNLGKLQTQFNAQKLDDRDPGQHIQRRIAFGLGAIQRGGMHIRQERLQFRTDGLGVALRARIRSDEMAALPRLRRFRRQQSFDIAVAHDQARNLRTRLRHKLGAEMNIVPQVVDAELQAFE